MADAEVSRLSKDIILKHIVDGLRGDFFVRFGLALPPIVEALPTELPVLEVRGQRTDLLFRLADGSILHLEFQTTRKGADLLRFAQYNLAVVAYYHAPGLRVYTVVIYGPGIPEAPDTLDTGSNVFQVRNLFLGQEDAEAVLARLRDKQASGEPFEATDRIDLVLLPLMRQQRPLEEVLREVAAIAAGLPREERARTIGALVGLAYHYVDEAVSAELLEGLRMANAIEELLNETIAQGIAQGVAQGRAEGRADGERRMLRRFLARRFGSIPAVLDARIEAAGIDEVERLFDQAATAADLSAIDQNIDQRAEIRPPTD